MRKKQTNHIFDYKILRCWLTCGKIQRPACWGALPMKPIFIICCAKSAFAITPTNPKPRRSLHQSKEKVNIRSSVRLQSLQRFRRKLGIFRPVTVGHLYLRNQGLRRLSFIFSRFNDNEPEASQRPRKEEKHWGKEQKVGSLGIIGGPRLKRIQGFFFEFLVSAKGLPWNETWPFFYVFLVWFCLMLLFFLLVGFASSRVSAIWCLSAERKTWHRKSGDFGHFETALPFTQFSRPKLNEDVMKSIKTS